MILDDVFVKDIQFSSGLKFHKWYNDIGNWTYDGAGKWTLDRTLRVKQSASFIVEFTTSELGVLVNNVTSGYMNYTLSHSTNTTTTLPNPEMSVRKISNNKLVRKGKSVSFTIIVENTGKYDITGLYIIDKDYTDGLRYDFYVDPNNEWEYVGEGRWNYNGILKVGMKCKIVIFFVAIKTGLQNNTVIAGNNQTNKTVNSTNHTNVTNKTTPKKKPKPHRDHNNTTDKKIKVRHTTYDKNATGNPLFALILVLISLKVLTFRRRK